MGFVEMEESIAHLLTKFVQGAPNQGGHSNESKPAHRVYPHMHHNRVYDLLSNVRVFKQSTSQFRYLGRTKKHYLQELDEHFIQSPLRAGRIADLADTNLASTACKKKRTRKILADGCSTYRARCSTYRARCSTYLALVF
jgi:hypothetical protein